MQIIYLNHIYMRYSFSICLSWKYFGKYWKPLIIEINLALYGATLRKKIKLIYKIFYKRSYLSTSDVYLTYFQISIFFVIYYYSHSYFHHINRWVHVFILFFKKSFIFGNFVLMKRLRSVLFLRHTIIFSCLHNASVLKRKKSRKEA